MKFVNSEFKIVCAGVAVLQMDAFAVAFSVTLSHTHRHIHTHTYTYTGRRKSDQTLVATIWNKDGWQRDCHL